MDRYIANGYILAIRFYHTAVQMLYMIQNSHISFLSHVQAISVIFKDYQPVDKNKFPDSEFPRMEEVCKVPSRGPTRLFTELLLGNEMYTFRKLARFVNDYLPESFWSEMEDDAKPEYLYGIIGLGPDGQAEERLSTLIRN